jgi:hypothetical protein
MRHRQEHLGMIGDERPRPKRGQVNWDSLALHLPQRTPQRSGSLLPFRISKCPTVACAVKLRLLREGPARLDGC